MDSLSSTKPNTGVKSIVTMPLSDFSSKCRGIELYNYPDGGHRCKSSHDGIYNFDGITSSNCFMPSTVGTRRGAEKDLTKRSSKSSHLEINFPFKNYLDLIVELVPEKYRDCIAEKPGNVNSFGYQIDYKAILYEEGDFFAKHSDTITDQYHFATVLILMPGKFPDQLNEEDAYELSDPNSRTYKLKKYYKNTYPELVHEGGTLRIWDQSGKVYEFKSSELTEPLMVAFHPNLEHECTPITSGKRLVFKFSWHFVKDKYDIVRHAELGQFNPVCCDDDDDVEDDVRGKLAEVQNSINDLFSNAKGNLEDFDVGDFIRTVKNELKDLKEIRNISENRVKKELYNMNFIIEKLTNLKEKGIEYVFIPLLNFYPDVKPTFLYTPEFVLYLGLKENYSSVTIVNTYSEYKEDNKDNHMYYFYRAEATVKNTVRLYPRDYVNNYEECGKKEYRSEYNDEDWDNKVYEDLSQFLVKL